MLWQLFASAYAQPLHLPQRAMTAGAAVQHSQPCHEQMGHEEMAGELMQNMEDMHMDASSEPMAMHGDGSHSDHLGCCKTGCKCPYGGTPALSFAVELVTPLLHESIYAVALADGIVAPPPSKLLRPPI